MDAQSAAVEVEAKTPGAPSAVRPASPEEVWPQVAGLPCMLSVELPVAVFKVRDLLMLDVETVVDSGRPATSKVPVCVNGARVGWAEFDVLRTRLAIRISELG